VSSIKSDLVLESEEDGSQALVAIIDQGIDILHSAFLDSDGRTRILSIWDQTDDSEVCKNPSGSCILGKEYTEDDINSYIENSNVPIALKYGYGRKHGTGVTSIAAGSRINGFSGIASGSKIIVIIPIIEGKPGFKVSYDLALQHIKSLARLHNKPVVVNISQGLDSGGRDGNSFLEKSCDHFSNHAQEPGLIIVKSAGNERNKKSHAKLTVSKKSPCFLRWQSLLDSHKRRKIELWFSANNLMKFQLTNPQKEVFELNECNQVDTHKFSSGSTAQLSYDIQEHDGIFSMVIHPAPNDKINDIWKLNIFCNSPEDNDIHAWIQHINGNARDRLISFIDHIDEKTTLTIPGTANTVITVGSVSLKDSSDASYFSSLGPTRDGRKQPIIAAVGEDVTFARAGAPDGTSSNWRGTSFAAAKVTGAIALLLSARKKWCEENPSLNFEQFNATEIKEILIEMTSDSTETWNPAIGYGVLDIEKLIANLQILSRR
jgi:subtilisin family serine protease